MNPPDLLLICFAVYDVCWYGFFIPHINKMKWVVTFPNLFVDTKSSWLGISIQKSGLTVWTALLHIKNCSKSFTLVDSFCHVPAHTWWNNATSNLVVRPMTFYDIAPWFQIQGFKVSSTTTTQPQPQPTTPLLATAEKNPISSYVAGNSHQNYSLKWARHLYFALFFTIAITSWCNDVWYCMLCLASWRQFLKETKVGCLSNGW